MDATIFRRAWSLVGFGRLRTLSIVTFSHAFVAVALFLQMVLLARVLPLEVFGQIATFLAISTIMEAAVGARGSETALGAFAQLSEVEQADRELLARRLLRIDLIWSVSIYSVLAASVIVYDAVTGAKSWWLLILMIGSVCAFPWGTIKSYLTVFHGPRAFPPIELAYASVALVMGIGLSLVFGGTGFMFGMVLASLVRSVMAFRQSRLPLSFSAENDGGGMHGLGARHLWWLGATGTLRSGLMNAAGQMDILLLASASSPASVALYRAAKTLSGLVQRVTQPVWFVLKRHVIVGSGSGNDPHSRRMVLLGSLGFAAAGAAVVPALLLYGEDLMALAFGEQYRGSAQALIWLVPGAWILYAVTGWSGLFGSIVDARLTVIALYVFQIAMFAIVALSIGITHASIALALATSQALITVGFWWLFLRRAGRSKT